ncbi:MAG: GAF domain-containing protein [Nitrospinota bacterium]
MSFDLSTTLQRIVTESLRVLAADRAALFLWQPEANTVRVESSVGLSQGYLEAVSKKWKELPVGLMLQDLRLCSWPNARTDPQFKPLKARIEREGYWSIVIVPLLSEGVFQGWLALYFNEVRHLSDEEKSTIQTYADMAAVGIDNARALEEIRIRSERQEALRKVTRDITEDLDLKTLFSRICKSVSELLGVDLTHLLLLDEKTGALNIVSSFGEKEGEELPLRTLPQGKGISHRVASRKEPVAVPEVLKGPDWLAREWAERAGVRSFLGIPLLLEDRVVGVLNCLTKQVRHFKGDEIELMQDFADQAAVALGNARAFEEVRRKSAQIAKLNEINRKLTSTLDLDEIFASILEASKELVGGRYAAIFLYDEAQGNLTPHLKTCKRFAPDVELPRLRPGEGLAGWVAQHRRPVMVLDPQRDPRWVMRPWNENRKLGAFAGMPLVSRGALLGVLCFFAEGEQGLKEEGFNLLTSFADQAAIAVEKAKSFEQVSRKSAQIAKLNEINRKLSSVLDLAEVLETIVRASQEMVGGIHVAVFLCEQEGRTLIPHRGSLTKSPEDVLPLKVGQGLTGWVAQHREVLALPEARSDPRWKEMPWSRGGVVGAYAGMPLLAGDLLLGVLSFFRAEPHEWRRDEIDLLNSFAAQAAIAIEKAQQMEALRARLLEQQGLVGALEHVASGLDVATVIQAVVRESARVMGTDRCSVMLADERTGEPQLFSSQGISPEFVKRLSAIPEPFPVGRAYLSDPARTEPTVIRDLENSPGFGEIHASEGHRTLSAFPLRQGNRNIGALFYFWTTPLTIDEHRLRLGQAFADQVALAIENARLFTEAQKRATNLQILDEISKAIDSTLDLNELFKITVEQVKRVVPCARASLFSLDADQRVVSRIYTVDDVKEREYRIAPLDLTGTYFEQILETKRPLYTPDARKDPHPRRQSLAAEGLRSIVNVPILGDGDCIGFLNLASPEVDALTNNHIELLRSVADHLALAMKNAELYANVRVTSERLDNFVRSASDGIVTIDLERRFTSWNPAAEAIYGYREEEVLGRNVSEIFSEEVENEDIYQRLLLGETVPAWEKIERQKNGTPVEVSVTLSAAKDNSGRVVGFSGINREIGAKKRAEEALRKSEKKYRTLFEQASDAIEIVDEEGRIVDCNQHACDLLGYTRQEMLEKRVQDIVAPEYRDSVAQRISQITEVGLPPYESVNVRKDGTPVPIEVSATPIEIGGRNHVIYFLRDITERRQAETALRESEERFCRLSRASFEGVAITENGRILDANQTLARMLGYEPHELIGMEVQGTVPPEYRNYVLKRNLSGYEKTFEAQCLRKDGSVFPVEVHGGPIPYQGRTVRVAAIRDITERKRAEEELQKTQALLVRSEKMAAVGTLVAGVAHETLNPLNNLSVQIQMLKRGILADDPKRLSNSYQVIDKQVNRIARITQNLLQFTRCRESQMKKLDVRSVLDRVVDLVEDPYRLEKMDVVRDYDPHLPLVEADEDRLSQVFLNLIGNAKDAMPEGGRVTLRARSSTCNGSARVRIEVEDTGTGITKDVLNRIFDPFFTTKPEGKGTGLGLSVSYGIVENHGGKLDVESKEGKGTTFLVELPATMEVGNGDGKNPHC